MESYLCFS